MVNEKGIDMMDKRLDITDVATHNKIFSDVMGCLNGLSVADQLAFLAGLYSNIAENAYAIIEEDMKVEMEEYFIAQLELMKRMIFKDK